MNIGDKVRLVHGKEEGVVYRFLAGNIVEIEIEDGFRIPVLRQELVLVSPMEESRLLRKEQPVLSVPGSRDTRSAGPFSAKGIYLAFLPTNDRELSVHFINNTDWIIPFVVYEDKEGKHTGLGSGLLKPRSSQKLHDVWMKDFEQWALYEIQVLFFKDGAGTIPAPFQKKLKCRVQSFYKRKMKAPVLGKDAYVYQLDEDEIKATSAPEKPISAAEIRERMLSPQPAESLEPVTAPQAIIDLHLEKLSPNSGSMSNSDKLTLQLSTFEKQLEKAIAAGMDDITFIHGAGNGVLKTEIHRRLGKNQHVQYFKDAQKEKFGYGATFVKIK
ncbi:Smr/MutS family protein [Arundinibacter roseus]|uniref:DUF2027 domain-containing protein n=1 Tax=Arundinibacter roseus TaxID=2070510 RepID=A0A4R4JRX0_9BACT|nr:DUF2027 domain-containing protein [Arundinibacter roseus]TDB57327.1 DUF2027 domain-containing protein [Arundinibacter roseus]